MFGNLMSVVELKSGSAHAVTTCQRYNDKMDRIGMARADPWNEDLCGYHAQARLKWYW